MTELVLTGTLTESQVDDLMALYAPEFWTGHRTRDDVVTMLRNSDVIVGVVRDGRLVGFARVLTDFVYRATLYDVIVAPDARGAGVGRVVMDAVIHHPRLGRVESIDLSCRPDKIDLYRKWGFDTDLSGTLFMRRKRS